MGFPKCLLVIIASKARQYELETILMMIILKALFLTRKISGMDTVVSKKTISSVRMSLAGPPILMM